VWRLGVAAEGALRIVDITTDGTAGCFAGLFRECRRDGGIEYTTLTGPPDGRGPRTDENAGAASIIVLTFTGLAQLGEGSHTICKVRVSGEFPAVDGEIRPARLFFTTRFVADDVPYSLLAETCGREITLDHGDPPLTVEDCTVYLKASSVAPFARCDANADGRLQISDVVWMLTELFVGGATTACRAAADCDGDGERNISDSLYALSYLFLGGPRPPAPYPECGRLDIPVEECPPESTGCGGDRRFLAAPSDPRS